MLPSILLFCLVPLLDAWEDGCRASRPGDCDPVSCGGTCEARYIRFYDKLIKGDRTMKSCQCAEEKICQIIGMHAYAGCRSYATLTTAGQRLIRLWSMDTKDKRNRFSNDVAKRYSDKKRHYQLLYGNSRFCCRSHNTKMSLSRPQLIRTRARALHLRSEASGPATMITVGVSLVIVGYLLK